MPTALEWKRSYPTKPGFFFYRLNLGEEPEVIEVYLAGRMGGVHRYNWTDPELLLGKRMHDPEAVSADELSGFYLVAPGAKAPEPVAILENSVTVAKPKKKKKAKVSEPQGDPI
jgi:hypothetical protein